jgi:DnaJ-class molecular chaperone
VSWDNSKFKKYDPEREGYGNTKEWKRSFRHRMEPDEAKQILNEDDPWVILCIPNPSTKNVIKKAYRDLAIKWHPDKNPANIELSTKMMQKINAAYDLLYY